MKFYHVLFITFLLAGIFLFISFLTSSKDTQTQDICNSATYTDDYLIMLCDEYKKQPSVELEKKINTYF